MKRQHAVWMHRWVGLVLALFLTVAGLTGSVLPFYRDLDAALSPQLMKLEELEEPAPSRPRDPLDLREQVLQRHPGWRMDRVPLAAEPGWATMFVVQAEPGQAPLLFDELYVDPRNGRELGRRMWGDLGEGLVNLMPFVYRLHYSLALEPIGTRVLGIVALLWTLDCLVGAWLTFPPRGPRREGMAGRQGPSWWSRWRHAWRVRRDASGHRLTVDLHRAGGLWLWAVLFVMAWSAVSFNLRPVYQPVMSLVFDMPPGPAPATRVPLAEAEAPDWRQARERARSLMREAALEQHAEILREEMLVLDRKAAVWRYVVTTDRDLRRAGGKTTLAMDVRTGEPVSVQWPTGAHAGQTVETWLTHLHMARVGGLPLRVLVSTTGLALVGLSLTGVGIWWRKRQGRRQVARSRLTLPRRPAFQS